jgi:prepilin-type N-terminal cleavage/methylation domain-containing protein
LHAVKTIPFPLHPIRAFSLVELLVVIAVIAIVAAIALPNLINISHKTTFAKNRRNAQTVASIASAAKGAGVTVDLSGTNAISLLQPPGVAVMSGSQELSFSVSPMNEEEQAGAAVHLESSGDINMAVRLKEE